MKLITALFASALFLTTGAIAQEINFGNNDSDYSGDGECDDRRFEGVGMAESLRWTSVGGDAQDCSDAFDAGTITLWDYQSAIERTDCSAIDFGSNGSEYSNDGACDDPRFEGLGSAELPSSEHRGRDANDCQQLCEFDMIFVREAAPVIIEVEDPFFGTNAGDYARDGECDDRRFVGPGMADSLRWDNVGRDADDCREALSTKMITLWDQEAAAVQTDCATIDFGDDFSDYSNDGVCDDMRFEGRGAASLMASGSEGGDASDCQRMCNYGMIFLRDIN